MRLLRAHHITNLVTVVDSFLPRAAANPKGGRPLVLHPNEVIALLLFSSFVAPQRTMQGIYNWAQTYYYRRFHLCSYPSFVRKCHQALPGMCVMLDQLLVKDAALRFMDSTMLHVCKLVRADRHRVAKGVAAFGKNWQGWHSLQPMSTTANRYRTWSMTPLALPSVTVPTMLLSCEERCGVSTKLTSWHHHTPNKTKSSLRDGSSSCSTSGPALNARLTT